MNKNSLFKTHIIFIVLTVILLIIGLLYRDTYQMGIILIGVIWVLFGLRNIYLGFLRFSKCDVSNEKSNTLIDKIVVGIIDVVAGIGFMLM